MRRIFSLYLLFILIHNADASDGYPRRLNSDVLHYEFALSINDSTDRIGGRARILLKLDHSSDSVYFDLMCKNMKGKGMEVTDVTATEVDVTWKHISDRLIVFFNRNSVKIDTMEFVIEYGGIPEDGLIISSNKFGNRTFFADHWPDRAHCYLPCVDHPYDKSSVDFLITAPDRYKIIANGILIEESDLPGNFSFTHWKETIPLATKVMTFGAAEFAIKSAGVYNHIPVWTWVYPENRNEGFYDYSVAMRPLEYFSTIIGKYPYLKLANVQSKTIYGGLENAGTIFYSENSVSGKGKVEGLMAHEIAHQWFGNSVSEADWHHIWLSEGFATYLTSLYFESLKGKERLRNDLISARTRVIKYYETNRKPLIDTTETILADLLNPNSYQKGAWVLHMLRHEIGDEAFMKGLQLYYKRFCNRTALSADFINIMEEVSERNLKTFFKQWLYLPGHPQLKIWHKPGIQKGTFEVYIEQLQNNIFEFNIELLIKELSGEKVKNVFVRERTTKVIVSALNEIEIIPDPNVNLLFN